MTSPVAQVLDRLETTNTTTPWPLVLFLHATPGVPDEQAVIGTLALDSYLMRRAVCRLGTKDYNRLFGTLLGVVKAGDVADAGDVLVNALASQTAENRMWPDDGAFISGLLNGNLYNDLVRARLRTLLVGLENQLLTTKAEPTVPHRAASKAFTVEHVMPVKWEQHWALPSDASDEADARRQAHIHSLGNLTLATQSLNSTLSNDPWLKKRLTLQSHSLARLTTGFILAPPEGVPTTQDAWVSEWNEERISLRALALARVALAAWPRPGDSSVDPGTRLFETSFQPTPAPTEARTFRPGEVGRSVYDVSGSILPLIQAGLVRPGDQLHHERVRSGHLLVAEVTAGGRIETNAGTFNAPSTALGALLGYEVNGWRNWIHVRTGKTLAELRDLLTR
jgi:hypothetical protein